MSAKIKCFFHSWRLHRQLLQVNSIVIHISLQYKRQATDYTVGQVNPVVIIDSISK